MILRRLKGMEEERALLETYPVADYADIVSETGFSCTCCGRCCTKAANDHVFLLDEDVRRIRQEHPDVLVPAPYFEACDQNGRFFVSGYALKTADGNVCTFLNDSGRCRIYGDRPLICRVYPYMLHREPDESGNVHWCHLSGLNTHGEYHVSMTSEDASAVAEETIRYEKEYLDQQIAFIRALLALFEEEGLRYVRRTYDLAMRGFCQGETVPVMVFCDGRFEETVVSRDMY
ncbi:YkgJ family cysteine cluster protein [Methanogenium sp. S4BF]|uniref:YkgJ family cysteine cluster protein n=1 Tax=Methanogenium sp. S4BF TaxID=1789226 RepID=UPI002417D575|nr:YkgJ family cysteine cluster protein [Methanogenium sp. S4BF]WFN35574.1 YkgJ family cysteine cluster protein [Methanogenium sp. S4BF]